MRPRRINVPKAHADFEPVNKNSQSYHGMKHKMPFIHTVAVPERVAVQQNIPYYGASIQTCENMDSKALKGREKPGSLASTWALVSEPGRMR